jgi:MbtH protein
MIALSAFGITQQPCVPVEQMTQNRIQQRGVLMNSIFEDKNGHYLVLANIEGRHSLWPVSIEVPRGWDAVYGEATRQDCLDFIDAEWTDMRPRGLSNS